MPRERCPASLRQSTRPMVLKSDWPLQLLNSPPPSIQNWHNAHFYEQTSKGRMYRVQMHVALPPFNDQRGIKSRSLTGGGKRMPIVVVDRGARLTGWVLVLRRIHSGKPAGSVCWGLWFSLGSSGTALPTPLVCRCCVHSGDKKTHMVSQWASKENFHLHALCIDV